MGASTAIDPTPGRKAAAQGGLSAWLASLLFCLLALACVLPAGAHAAAAPQPAAPAQDAPSYSALADLLENEQSRQALIEQLRALAADGAPASGTPAPPGGARAALPDEAGEPSLSRRIADGTQEFFTDLGQGLAEAAAAFRSVGSGEGARGISMQAWLNALAGLALVVLATLLSWFVFRVLAARLYARLDRWLAQVEAAAAPAQAVPGAPLPAAPRLTVSLIYRRALAVLGALLVDVGVIVLAALVGYGVGLFATGQSGRIGTLESMFVNAFVAVEIAKALVRVVFATRYPYLRLLKMNDDVAVYWNAWLARLITLTGYGLLIVVPVIRAMFSPAVGQMVGLLIMLGVYGHAVRVIWVNRQLLRQRLEAKAQGLDTAFIGTLLRMLARVWHVLAIAYFTVLLVVSQIAPNDALPFMAKATGQTILAIAIGLLLSALLGSVLAHRIQLPEHWRARLPMLEARLNSYVPAAIKGLRLLILLWVLLMVLDAWRAFNLSAWIASERGSAAIFMVVHVGIILAGAALVWTLIASIIEHRLNANADAGGPTAREKTLLALFRNAALIVIVTMTVLIVLSQIGINIGPLIAGAGVVGLAIGFGAQKLVQDIITGVFIQLENGMNQNDVVEAGGVFGTVEKLTIRSVGIRTLDGGYHLVPFSSVDVVVNHMRDFSYHLGEYTIAHRESVDEAIVHLKAAFAELQADEVLGPELLEDITVAGVTSLSERGVTIRVLIKTTPGMQWAVQRGYNRLVKKHFDAARIELPYPHTVVYFGQDKNGKAPPVRVQTIEAQEVSVPETATAAGHTPRKLKPAAPQDAADVLGNELETVVDEDGEKKDQPEVDTTGRDRPGYEGPSSPKR
ncbi:mechanosensitive ion channel domain-containing protein [Orrella sp. JC864]|uniref:mechanosensitive ion channel domain-containing protein n=1 Tax=Orrella sp. JC864 TaxID=3120298 RepID=UPI00300AC494